MAMTYIVGIPRSGKTYYVMYQLWKYFVYVPKETKITKFLSKIFKPKPIHNYDLAYTNINQFDFSKTDKIKKLDFDDLKLKLTELYNMYMAKSTDDEILVKAKEYNLHNVLITIDEVHNFLGTKVDDVLKWWLTYHGHLHQDLYFITQDLSLVAGQYKSNAEFFFRAIPPSARLSTKKFRYTQYRNSRMAMNGKIADFTIPAIQEIYDMYVSGAENKSKSVVKKFLVIGGVLSFILLGLVFIFISRFNTDEKIDPNTNLAPVIQTITSSIENNTTSIVEENKKDDEELLYEFKCFKELCSYKDTDFPKLLLSQIINSDKVTFAYRINSKSFTKYFVLTNKKTFNFLQIGGKENETDTKKFNKGTNTTFNLL